MSNLFTYREDKISEEEYAVLARFASHYRSVPLITADYVRQEYKALPGCNDHLIQKEIPEEKYVIINKMINYNRKKYRVKLELSFEYNGYNLDYEPTVYDISIAHKDKAHLINCSRVMEERREIIDNIKTAFKRRIYTPEEHYLERMNPSSDLSRYINKRDWISLYEEVDTHPEIADILFLDERKTSPMCEWEEVSFSTLLYQLIRFRIEHKNDWFMHYDNDLIDQLISEISQSELVKVEVSDTIKGVSFPTTATSSSLMRNYEQERIHSSEIKSVENGELIKEKKVLEKTIKRVNLMNKGVEEDVL